jgi:uncharacterized protein (TIGR00255 family)
MRAAMALRSMTGFGRATVPEPSGEGGWVVEIRSVNHRFLDQKLRLPAALTEAEPAIRAALSQRLRRGRIDLVVLSPQGEEVQTPRGFEIDSALAARVVDAHRALAHRFQLPMTLDSVALAAYPGVLVPTADFEGVEALRHRVIAAVEAAADALLAARHSEGHALGLELTRRLDAIDHLRADIEARAPEQGRAYRVRLEARMREMLGALDLTADAARVMHEVAIFAEKTDIAEELARLGIHLEQARRFVQGEGGDEEGIGRRFDFLCQEMNREANTIGSKVQDVQISERIIEMKAELERLREQVQNVE